MLLAVRDPVEEVGATTQPTTDCNQTLFDVEAAAAAADFAASES